MKKIALVLFSLLAFTLPSCGGNGNSKYLDRPEDTNLEFWITQKVERKDFEEKGCTFLPGWFGASEYLDSRYQAVEEDGGMPRQPEVCVTYLMEGYPDTSDKQKSVVDIYISDPEIFVYGLTMKSSKEEIGKRMDELGAKKEENEGVFTIKTACFSFSERCISISVPVSNKYHIIY